jgi:hypothetical protein
MSHPVEDTPIATEEDIHLKTKKCSKFRRNLKEEASMDK